MSKPARYASFLFPQPSCESFREEAAESEPYIDAKTQRDDQEFASQVREVNAITQQIDAANTRAETLESLITVLENHDGKLTRFQSQVVYLTAEKIGVTLKTSELGFSLEAFEGSRGRALINIALEGFKETLRKVIDFVIAMLKKLGEFLLEVLLGIGPRLNTSRDVIKNRRRLRKNVAFAATKGQMCVNALSIHGDFNPDKLLSNVELVLKGVTDASFHEHIHAFPPKAVAIAAKMSGDPTNWRRYVEEINQLEVPTPEGFALASNNGSEAVYHSVQLFAGSMLSYHGVQEVRDTETKFGKKGAIGRVQALAKVRFGGTVGGTGNSSDRLSDAVSTLTRWGNAGIEKTCPRVLSILDQADRAVKLAKASKGDADRTIQQIQAIQAVDDSALDHEVKELLTPLIRSAANVVALSAKLILGAADAANQAGNVWSHLATADLGR